MAALYQNQPRPVPPPMEIQDMSQTQTFKRKALPSMIAALLGGAGMSAQAVVITGSSATASSDYSINGSAPVAVTESSPPLAMVDIIQQAMDSGVDILTHPYLFLSQLDFGNRASGNISTGFGSYDVNASVVLNLDLDYSDSNPDTLTFMIRQGIVGVRAPDSGLNNPDFLRSSLDLLIEDITDPNNPVTLFASEYDAEANDSGASASFSGTALGPNCETDGNDAYCVIDAASYQLNLAEGINKLRYSLIARASGSLTGEYDCTSGGGGSEDGGDGGDGSGGSDFFDAQVANPLDQEGLDCGSIARTGDPLLPPVGAPEPASLALSALGLAALGLARRRRKQSV